MVITISFSQVWHGQRHTKEGENVGGHCHIGQCLHLLVPGITRYIARSAIPGIPSLTVTLQYMRIPLISIPSCEGLKHPPTTLLQPYPFIIHLHIPLCLFLPTLPLTTFLRGIMSINFILHLFSSIFLSYLHIFFCIFLQTSHYEPLLVGWIVGADRTTQNNTKMTIMTTWLPPPPQQHPNHCCHL